MKETSKTKSIKSVFTLKPNAPLTPVTVVSSKEEFNNLVKECKNKNYQKLIRTKSGGIAFKNSYCPSSYDVKIYNAAAELTIKDELGYRRIQLRRSGDPLTTKKGVSGTRAYQILTKNGSLENDIEEKQVELDRWYQKRLCGPYENIIFEHVNHLDLNSAFPYYLQIIKPEFKEIVEYHYKHRKVDAISKAIMNYGIGCMRYKMPNTWKWIMINVKKRLEEECKNIKGTILAFNVDGIWFTGNWKGTAGTELGQFKLDHKDVKIRFKSAGAYEYIEDGKYHSSQSGVELKYNNEWGDIYKNNPKGIIINKENFLEEVDKIDF